MAVYEVKHFLADYILQGRFMLGKFSKRKTEWIPALFAHAAVHAAFTFTIASMLHSPRALAVAYFDFMVHFAMDRIKASPGLLGRYEALSKSEMTNWLTPPDRETPEYTVEKARVLRSNRLFWWSLGLDQMVHNLTHLIIVWRILS